MQRRLPTRHPSSLRWWTEALYLGLLAVVLVQCRSPALQAPNAPQNLVIACLDTVRFDTFWLPEELDLVDDLQPWLSDALILQQTQAPSPWTVPSIASTLTGLYPNQHGAGRFASEIANLREVVPAGLAADLQGLPEILSTNGYETAAFVAHPWFKSGYGLERGFDSLHMRASRDDLLGLALDWLAKRRRLLQAGTGSDSREASAPTPSQVPFLLYLHFMEAHDAVLLRHLDEKTQELPAALLQPVVSTAPEGICQDIDGTLCRRYRAHVAAVLQLRRTVAQLLRGLSASGHSEDTIVVVFSDHGEEFGDHLQEQRSHASDPRGLSGFGHGHSLYQELLHVPVLIWHPDIAGRRLNEVTSLIDLVPSILDWLSLPSPRNRWPGRSLSRAPAPGGSQQLERYLFSSGIAFGSEQVSVRLGDWKRILYTGSGERNLFNLRLDPKERSHEARTEVSADLDRQLYRYLAVQPTSQGDTPQVPAEELERLQALGYLQGIDSKD